MKHMATAGAVAAAISLFTSAASAEVNSVNVVGVQSAEYPEGLSIVSMVFDPVDTMATNTPQSVYGDTLPEGSKMYSWNGSNYDISTYEQVFVPGEGLVLKWSNDFEVGIGMGYWVQLPGSGTNVTLTGSVPLDTEITIPILTGLQLLAFPYPVDRTVAELGFMPAEGDKIYVFADEGYIISTYEQVFVPGEGLVLKWSNESLTIISGQGFWYSSVSGDVVDWVVSRPFTLD